MTGTSAGGWVALAAGWVALRASDALGADAAGSFFFFLIRSFSRGESKAIHSSSRLFHPMKCTFTSPSRELSTRTGYQAPLCSACPMVPIGTAPTSSDGAVGGALWLPLGACDSAVAPDTAVPSCAIASAAILKGAPDEAAACGCCVACQLLSVSERSWVNESTPWLVESADALAPDRACSTLVPRSCAATWAISTSVTESPSSAEAALATCGAAPRGSSLLGAAMLDAATDAEEDAVPKPAALLARVITSAKSS